jgi:hypothetical protein
MSRALILSATMSITNIGDSGIMKKFAPSFTACVMKRAVFILSFFVSTAALAGPSLINASFETNNLYTNPNPTSGSGGYLYGAQWDYLGPVAVSAPGWSFKGTSPTPTPGGSGLSYSHTAWGGVASDGNTFAFLQNKGEIDQSFASASAENYQFSFDLVQRTTCCGYVGQQSVSVELDGNVIWSGTPGLTWATVSVNALDIAGGNHTLGFFGTNPNNVFDTSVFLDNVVMTSTPVPAAPVPEPETYAMMLVGLGLLGAIGRRRMPQG